MVRSVEPAAVRRRQYRVVDGYLARIAVVCFVASIQTDVVFTPPGGAEGTDHEDSIGLTSFDQFDHSSLLGLH